RGVPPSARAGGPGKAPSGPLFLKEQMMTVRQPGTAHAPRPPRWAARVGIGVLVGVSALLAGCGAAQNPRPFSIRSGAKLTRNVKFNAGTKVQIWVESEKDSDVDLFVFDEKGALVIKDERDDKNCYVAFPPASTGTFKIEVQNRVRLEP